MQNIHRPEQKITFKYILKYNLYFWGAWWIFYLFIFNKNIPIPLIAAFFSSIYLTLPLLVLSLILWPFIRYLRNIRISRYLLIPLHIILANLFTVIWLVVYYGILYALYGYSLNSMFNVSQTIGFQYPSGITYYFMVAGVYYSLIYYREVRDKEINEAKMESLLRDAQLKALKDQLKPHFLFNSLNSINALITSNPEQARSMLVKLADLLRLSLHAQKSLFVPVSAELEFAHAYLDIEKIRLGNRLAYVEKFEGNFENIKVPSMILQPLLENAIKHGIAPSSKHGTIELSMSLNENFKIHICNSTDPASKKSQLAGTGFGLINLRQRLDSLFGPELKFLQEQDVNHNFCIEIEFPIKATVSFVEDKNTGII